jgi:predicted nucleic acid-binding protein
MPILIDTNVLLRSVQTFHPMHVVAVRALEVLMQREEPLVITIQNIAEFWNVATRPAANNGLGFTIEEAQEELIKLEGFFQVLSENLASYTAWKTLLIANHVSGIQVHDTRLVAVMKTYGIAQIVTFNVSDFARFPEIEVIHPDKFTERA